MILFLVFSNGINIICYSQSEEDEVKKEKREEILFDTTDIFKEIKVWSVSRLLQHAFFDSAGQISQLNIYPIMRPAITYNFIYQDTILRHVDKYIDNTIQYEWNYIIDTILATEIAYRNGRIKRKWVYRYNEALSLLKEEAYNDMNKLIYTIQYNYEIGGMIKKIAKLNKKGKRIEGIEYEYNYNGDCTEILYFKRTKNWEKKLEMSYDEHNHLVSEKIYNKFKTLVEKKEYQYTAFGEVESESIYNGPYLRLNEKNSYLYDGEDRIIQLIRKDEHGNEQKKEVIYNESGRVVKESFYSRSSDDYNWVHNNDNKYYYENDLLYKIETNAMLGISDISIEYLYW